jgi:hypothetical protein
MKEKLQEYALIAEIISSVAIIATLVVLILEVKENTSAIQSSNIQSVAERSQQFSLAGFNIEEQQRGSLLVTALKLGEESFIQYKNGLLPEDYWQTRADFVLAFMSSEESKRSYQTLKLVLVPEYQEWIEESLGMK